MPDRSRAKTPEPLVVRGALFALRRRCGKPNCHCATGEMHESPALAYPVGGKTKTLTLGSEDVAEVRTALKRYTRAKAQLDREADAGIEALRKRRVAKRSTPRR